MQQSAQILIVEDDLLSAEYLKEILKQKGYEVIGIVDKGREAIQLCKKSAPDIILMDIMLKDNISGSEAALELHNNHCKSKVIFVTAYAEEEMLDYAARSKAYGYILKPYREQEIFATIRLALAHDRNEEEKSDPDIVQLKNNFTFYLSSSTLYKNGKEIPLAKKKRKLLEVLVKNRNHSVPNEQLCRYVWGDEQNYSTLRSLVYRIRTAVGEELITNVNGLGYMIS